MNSDIVILGAGGHAKVCIEIFQAMGETIAFCVGGPNSPDYCLDVRVLKGDEHLTSLRLQGYKRAFIAIGDNQLRDRLGDKCRAQGYQLANAISPHAAISPSATLGIGIAVMAGAIINAKATVADLVIINTGATIDHDCQVGRAAHIAPQCALAGNVTIGIQSFLGIGSKVIPDIRIGDRVTIGAGGVVINNIDSDATAVGNPAKVSIQKTGNQNG